MKLRHDRLVARISLQAWLPRGRRGRARALLGRAGHIVPLVDPRRYMIWLEQALA